MKILDSSILSFLVFIIDILLIKHLPFYKIHIVFYCELMVFFNIFVYKMKFPIIYTNDVSNIISNRELCLILVNFITFYITIIPDDHWSDYIFYVVVKILIVYALHHNYYDTVEEKFINDIRNTSIEIYDFLNYFKTNIIFIFLITFILLWMYDIDIDIYKFCNLIININMISIMIYKWIGYNFIVTTLPNNNFLLVCENSCEKQQ